MKPKLLLHVCCAFRCLGYRLGISRIPMISCVFGMTRISYLKRNTICGSMLLKVCEIENIPYIVGEYDSPRFLQAVRGHENDPERGDRCTICYDLRLRTAAEKAKELGIGLYTTSLNISPKMHRQTLSIEMCTRKSSELNSSKSNSGKQWIWSKCELHQATWYLPPELLRMCLFHTRIIQRGAGSLSRESSDYITTLRARVELKNGNEYLARFRFLIFAH